MQWLIDLIIEAIGIPPTFIDRDHLNVADFNIADLTQGSVWTELDLSGIIPTNASAVLLHVRGTNTAIEEIIRFRPHWQTAHKYRCQLRTAVANVGGNANPVVAVDSERKIEYYMSGINWSLVWFTVHGWWL